MEALDPMILFLFLFIFISVEAQSHSPSLYDINSHAITKTEIQLTDNLLNRLIPDIMTGREREIKAAVFKLKSLPNIGKRMAFYEVDSQAIEAGNIFFHSVVKNYKNLKADINSPMWASLVFDQDLDKVEEIKTIVRDLRLSLIFFSLAGFNSLDGKNKYLDAFYQFQVLLATLFELYKQSQVESGMPIKTEWEKVKYLKSVRSFQEFYKQFIRMYFQIIEPFFQKLSWLQNDLESSSLKKRSKYKKIVNNHNRLKEAMSPNNGDAKFSLSEKLVRDEQIYRAGQKSPPSEFRSPPSSLQKPQNLSSPRSSLPREQASRESHEIRINGERRRELAATKRGEGELFISEGLTRNDKINEERGRDLAAKDTVDMDSLRGLTSKGAGLSLSSEEWIADDKIDIEAVRGLTAIKRDEGELFISKELTGNDKINEERGRDLAAKDTVDMDSLRGLTSKGKGLPLSSEELGADKKIDMEAVRGLAAPKSGDTDVSIFERLGMFCRKAFSK